MSSPLEFRLPRLDVDADTIEAYFDSEEAAALAPLPNVHQEARVDAEAAARATPASVLIPIVLGEPLEIVMTRRHHSISSPGHVCFPGGRADPADDSVVATALREAEEEIGLDPQFVRVVGRLGDYVSHSGFRIAPVVGLVTPPVVLSAREGEVEEILNVPLSKIFDARAYALRRHHETHAHFFFEHEGAFVTGPTVSIMMGFYRALAGLVAS